MLAAAWYFSTKAKRDRCHDGNGYLASKVIILVYTLLVWQS